MRPLKLKVKGFTSFRDEQELDFRDLDVFAITGPTGAGKSSLLDAITYALYGEVERVGRECGQLVSHGLPRLAVTLDFEVDCRQYRITRTTPAKTGPTKVLLERYLEGGWRSYGEGADRVRDVNEFVKKLIGLDYSGFTRSVLLPQGKFAEFMAGKPEERRAIMSDLLGLGLFKRMAQRAGRLSADAENLARAKLDVLNSQFADVTPEALQSAQIEAERTGERLAALEKASTAVNGLLEEWRTEQTRAKDLGSCANDLRAWRAKLCTAVGIIESLASNLANDMLELERATVQVESLRNTVETARRERLDAESRWGSALELAAAVATARRLPALRQQIVDKTREVEEASARVPTLDAALAAAQETHRELLASNAESQRAVDAARTRLREVEHANMAAALAAGLRIGDACPVCGEALDHLPVAPAATEISEASAGVRVAEKALATAQKSASAAERDLDRVTRDMQENEKAHARVSAELTQLRAGAADAEQELSTAVRGPLPEDVASVLSERIAALKTLGTREQSATAQHVKTQQLQASLSSAVALQGERLRAQREVLVDQGEALLSRALAGIGDEHERTVEPRWPQAPATDATAEELLGFGNAKVRVLDAFTAELAEVATVAAAAESRLLQCARESVGELLPACQTLTGTAEAVSRATNEAVAQQASAMQRAAFLSDALQKRAALESEIAEHTTQATRYQSLATDLRADRLIAFLQDEALNTLAAVGSRYLFELSSERYELAVDRDFYVVDKWSADEKRSVRTLSGGETFLASLSLALALSEQVRALSVTERARLDSLFLDEGFGTLDPDTLRVVVEAIEKLSGGGRLVGVITHVPELAEQFQRIEVEKSPRGSHLVLRN